MADAARSKFETAHRINLQHPCRFRVRAAGYNQLRWDECMDWSHEVLRLDPNDKEALYRVGVIAWAQWVPVDRKARADSHQLAEDTGPIRDPQRAKREVAAPVG